MSTSKHNFIIMIDALRHDYICEEDSPFLFNLKQHARCAEVVETFAFQTRPAYFAGLDPDQSNICHLFKYSPKTSPFSFLKPFSGLLKALDPVGEIKAGRGVIKRVARAVERSKGFKASADVLGTERIPLWMLPYLAPAEREYTDSPHAFGDSASLFDLMRDKDKTWHWIGYPRHFGSTDAILKEYRNVPEGTDYVYLHFSELDWIGHKFGPNSHERKSALQELDSRLQELIEDSFKDGADIAIFGDHGMVEVESILDLSKHLQKLPLTVGRDYLVFLDSTQARIWYLTSGAQSAIESSLASLVEGHLLDETERRELGLEFSGREYGDAIFVLDKPALIHPSYFSRGATYPKGMHGYLPHIRDNSTQLLICDQNRSHVDLGIIQMTEIFRQLSEII